MSQPWPRDSNETASDQPGAVHIANAPPMESRDSSMRFAMAKVSPYARIEQKPKKLAKVHLLR
jgi:hypothetical protein